MFHQVETFLIALYTIVNDSHKPECAHLLAAKLRVNSAFSDSEVISDGPNLSVVADKGFLSPK